MPKTDLCVLVDKTSPMTKAADLKDKTTVVFAASPWAPLIDPYLKAGGLNRETAKIDFSILPPFGAPTSPSAPTA